jgi:phosphoglycolate phosphatase
MTPNSSDRFPFDIVGFDLDGTLLDSSADLAAAVNHALGLIGRPLIADEHVKLLAGGGAKNMLINALEESGGIPPEDFRPLYKEMLRYYEAHVVDHTEPFPGALDVLDRLEALGVKSAVVTNKFEALAVKALSQLGLIERFVTVIGGDTLGTANAKPSPAPIHAMIERLGGGPAAFVGDSAYDVLAARNAGVPSIAVSFGFRHDTVDELGADRVIDHFDELIPTLEQLGAR